MWTLTVYLAIYYNEILRNLEILIYVFKNIYIKRKTLHNLAIVFCWYTKIIKNDITVKNVYFDAKHHILFNLHVQFTQITINVVCSHFRIIFTQHWMLVIPYIPRPRSPRDHIIAPIRSKATEVNIIRKWTDRPCRVRNSWPPTHLMRCSHPSQWGDESYIRQTKHTHTQTIARHRSTEVEFQFARQFALNYNWHGITFPARRRRSFAFSEAS